MLMASNLPIPFEASNLPTPGIHIIQSPISTPDFHLHYSNFPRLYFNGKFFMYMLYISMYWSSIQIILLVFKWIISNLFWVVKSKITTQIWIWVNEVNIDGQYLSFSIVIFLTQTMNLEWGIFHYNLYLLWKIYPFEKVTKMSCLKY